MVSLSRLAVFPTRRANSSRPIPSSMPPFGSTPRSRTVPSLIWGRVSRMTPHRTDPLPEPVAPITRTWLPRRRNSQGVPSSRRAAGSASRRWWMVMSGIGAVRGGRPATVGAVGAPRGGKVRRTRRPSWVSSTVGGACLSRRARAGPLAVHVSVSMSGRFSTRRMSAPSCPRVMVAMRGVRQVCPVIPRRSREARPRSPAVGVAACSV